MMPQETLIYLNIALSALALLGHAKGYFSSGEKKLEGRVEKVEMALEKTLVDHDRRIQSVEGEIKHMPDKDSFQKMQLDLAELKGQITSMVKSSEATERATRRVEDFLLKTGGK